MNRFIGILFVGALTCLVAVADDVDRRLQAISQTIVDLENELKLAQTVHGQSDERNDRLADALESLSRQIAELRQQGKELKTETRLQIAGLNLAVAQLVQSQVSSGHPPTQPLRNVARENRTLGGELAAPAISDLPHFEFVKVSEDLEMQTTEVTQGLWKVVMGKDDNPSQFDGDELPVDGMTASDIAAKYGFLYRLNRLVHDEYTYRLPTSREWYDAALGGSEWLRNAATSYASLSEAEMQRFSQCAWYRATSPESPQPVGTRAPDSFGLHDMFGNVWEWTRDKVADSFTKVGILGGSWKDGNVSFMIGNIGFSSIDDERVREAAGFRLVRTKK